MSAINPIEQNLAWIASGRMGCTFAALFARDPGSIGWYIIIDPQRLDWAPDTALLSLIFPGGDRASVRAWALSQGMYTESVGPGLTGLRYRCPDGIAWVQYFGPDADVATRRTPVPMLTMAVRLSPFAYFRVGFTGVLHLAHASVRMLRAKVAERLWETSFTNTARQLGHKPGAGEAAKTTYHE